MRSICKIADMSVLIEYKYLRTERIIKPYLTDEQDCFEQIVYTDEEFALERQISPSDASDEIVEATVILRKFASLLIEKYNGFLFHSSAIEYSGEAYVFTALSGTGKSTHVGLLKKLLDDKVAYINDDKPFIRLDKDGNFYVYGSPWQGKHNLGANVKVPLKAIVKLKRGKVDEVKAVTSFSMLDTIAKQCYSGKDGEFGFQLFNLLNDLIKNVKCFELSCTPNLSAAKCTFENILTESL